MIQENKEILLKDLCGRLPYGIKILDIPANVVGDLFLVSTTDTVEYETNGGTGIQTLYNIKTYLRSMSSMTEEEKEEASEAIEIELKALQGPGGFTVENAASYTFMIDFYNKHHLDYRGLIEKELALEAPKGMYETE